MLNPLLNSKNKKIKITGKKIIVLHQIQHLKYPHPSNLLHLHNPPPLLIPHLHSHPIPPLHNLHLHSPLLQALILKTNKITNKTRKNNKQAILLPTSIQMSMEMKSQASNFVNRSNQEHRIRKL